MRRVTLPAVLVSMALAIGLCVACGPVGQEPPEVEEARFPELRGPYLGQEPPGDEPELFAPGIVSTGLNTRDVAITPDGDELYFSVSLGARTMIMVSRQVGGLWSEPVVAPFSGRHSDIEPVIAPDGTRFFFLSNRAPEGKPDLQGWGHQDIWVMDQVGEGWGEPYNPGPPVNTDAPEYFPSVTADGTLYFTREEQPRQGAIFRSRLVDGTYTEPERLPPEVNCGQGQFNAFIAADESYIIVPVLGRDDSLGGVDYYVVFRDDDDTWSQPVNMGEKVNRPDGSEWSASTSPDGRYLFFMSSRTAPEADAPLSGWALADLLGVAARPQYGSSDIYWVDAGIIEALRPSE